MRFVFLLLLASVAILRAQNPPFQNPFLDSNCFFPQIGVDIDTIYGSVENGYLGSYIHNLGPRADHSYGNVLIQNDSQSAGLTFWNQIQTGPTFNLHNLRPKPQHLFPSINFQKLRYGHFHDRSHLDLFDAGAWRIYWAHDNGDYDSINYTQLSTNIYGRQANGRRVISRYDNLSQEYVATLTNDTVDDIVVGFSTNDSVMIIDSDYFALFRGGSGLAAKDTAFEDTSLAIQATFPYVHQLYHYSVQGDFRGTGRDDLLFADESRNVFFFKNDPPFTLEKLLHSMLYDTLWTRSPRWNDSNSSNQRIYWFAPWMSLTMQALPKKKGDSSKDWVIWIPTKDSGNTVCIFRGGPDFGSHRITIDSASIAIRAPEWESHWPDGIEAAGDLTGTGNQVLYIAGDNGIDQAYQNFYVTGKALDCKIDIYNSAGAGAGGDTLTADSDTLGDFLMGLPAYATSKDQQAGKLGVGSIWLMHGSKKIPVRINPKFADVTGTLPNQEASLSLSPNPVTQGWSVATIVWSESEEAELRVRDMLGNTVQQEPIRLLGGTEQQRIYFRGLPNGVYEVTLRSRTHEARARVVIVR